MVIARKQGLEWQKIKRLGELQIALSVDLKAMIALVEETLHEAPYTKEEVVKELETTAESLEETSLTQNTKHIQSFKLRQRALHVFRGQWFNRASVAALEKESAEAFAISVESLNDLS
ncbi:hypothetical protein JTB14_028212 [Gonioctena quinquepunctata]|nr:hypothetical protein JTB14_028212 [Gonioctena quinquepunctata]